MQAMDPLILPDALAYAEAHTTAPPSHLAAVYESTRNDFPMWGMMVGRQEGRFLELLVFSAQATRVLEIGTFTGYSSIAMAAGLPEGGSIVSLEVDPHHAVTAPSSTPPENSVLSATIKPWGASLGRTASK